MTQVLEALLSALGPDIVRTGEGIPPRNANDSAGLAPQAPVAVLLPRSTEHVSQALAICHAHRQPVVTQGGLTGLAGGARPGETEIALSLERMSGIEELDRDSGTMTVLAGTPLQMVHQAAAEAGLMYGVDLGARGSCTIGGNVSTNAGGNQVLRYGMTRRNVRGLEVVLADGQVVGSLNKMLKNNAGYDWPQLFIGSEGTLGVVTRAVLALQPRPAAIETALLAVEDTNTAVAVLRALERALPGGLLSFEAMWSEFYAIATTTIGVAAPLAAGKDLYLIVEAPAGAPGQDVLATALEPLYENGLVLDATLAQSEKDRAAFWALRESVYEYARHLPKEVGFDISIPLNRMQDAIGELRTDVPAALPGAVWSVFGHIADSNVHVVIMPPAWSDEAKFAAEKAVYGVTQRFGGSVSAEHGIGRTKKPWLPLSRTEPELALMARIKAALDPGNILNPGRVF
jgi:FAD/FMN-containing dehydrogenase